MYDFDVKQPGEWVDLCIEDWNCGVDQEKIEAANKAERERKRLEEGNLIWKPWYANNMVKNPLEGYYCLLFRRLGDGKIYGCKWTIEFQYKLDEAGMVIPNDSEIEAYILFRTRYIDLETTFEYPEPQAEYCKVSELPTGDFVKTGYFLIKDVVKYMKDKDSDVFYDRLDPVTYNGMVASELQFGKPEKAIDDFGEEYVPNSAGDYMYFAYPDYSCAEYKAHQLRLILDGLMDFEDEYDETKEFVILETEG